MRTKIYIEEILSRNNRTLGSSYSLSLEVRDGYLLNNKFCKYPDILKEYDIPDNIIPFSASQLSFSYITSFINIYMRKFFVFYGLLCLRQLG